MAKIEFKTICDVVYAAMDDARPTSCLDYGAFYGFSYAPKGGDESLAGFFGALGVPGAQRRQEQTMIFGKA